MAAVRPLYALLFASLTACLALVPPSTRSGLCATRDGRVVRRAVDEDFDVDMLMLETEEKMGKSISALESNLGALRAWPVSLDEVTLSGTVVLSQARAAQIQTS